MTKRDFSQMMKQLEDDIVEGYYGWGEARETIWAEISDIQDTSEARWKEIKKLRKRLGIKD